MEQQIVVFELENEQYGLEISAVEGIIKMQSITIMPQPPFYVESNANPHGVVVPIMDLRRRFGLPARDWTKDTRVLVVYLNGLKVGMIVDGVSQVLRIQDEMIEPPTPKDAPNRSAVNKGVANLEDRRVILLDLSKVLSLDANESLADMLVAT